MRKLPKMGQANTLQEIRKHDIITYDELETALGSSPQTIKKNLIHLERQGLIRIDKPRAPWKGRPTWKGAKITVETEAKEAIK
jgi:predicted ArsR family transcriptional regulator